MIQIHAAGAAVLAFALASGTASAQQPAESKPAAPAAAKAAEFEVVEVPAVHAVVLSMKGSYDQHQSAFERLDAFLSRHRFSRAAPLFARYHNDPSVGEANLIWEVGSPVPADAVVEPPFEIKDLPAGPAVVHVHRGSYEELGAKWAALMQWTIANRHQPAGPTVQVFRSLMPPEIELRVPVSK